MPAIDWPAWRSVSAFVGALAVVSLVGFYPGYFRQISVAAWQVHFHLATLVAWLALLLTQTWLATQGQLERHRRLGRAGYVLVPLIVLGFVLVIDFGQRRHRQPALLGAAFFDGALFLLFYALAILKRKNASLHSRYMLLTAVALVDPGLGRAIAPQFSVPFELVFILALLVVSLVKRRPWQPFLVGAIAFPLLMAIVVYASVVRPEITDRLWTALWG
jgi:uncharacterized membrane protein YozB (DUF420 family)